MTKWLAVCVSTALASACAMQRPAPPPSGRAVAPLEVRWFRTSAEYAASARTVYAAARHRVEQLPDLCAKPDAPVWVVIMDTDETILDNSLYQAERAALGAGYTSASWNEWVGRKRPEDALPGVADFLHAVAQRCGQVVVVTNRTQATPKRVVDECAVTKARLADLFGSKPIADVLCAPTKDDGTPINDKNPRFERVARGDVPGVHGNVVMYIGDSITDFPAMKACPSEAELEGIYTKLGEEYFVLPNPMYGGWPGCDTPLTPRRFR